MHLDLHRHAVQARDGHLCRASTPGGRPVAFDVHAASLSVTPFRVAVESVTSLTKCSVMPSPLVSSAVADARRARSRPSAPATSADDDGRRGDAAGPGAGAAAAGGRDDRHHGRQPHQHHRSRPQAMDHGRPPPGTTRRRARRSIGSRTRSYLTRRHVVTGGRGRGGGRRQYPPPLVNAPGIWYRTVPSPARTRARGYAQRTRREEAAVTTATAIDDMVRAQLEALGIAGNSAIHRNLPPAELIARSLARAEGILAANGALVVKTGEPSGRSPERPRDRRVGAGEGADLLGRHQQAVHAGALRQAAGQGARLPARPRPLRVRRLRRRRAHLPAADTRGRRRHLARALRQHALRAAHAHRARGLRARLHGHQLRRPARQRRLRRHAQLGLRRHQLRRRRSSSSSAACTAAR